jgi:hypothetical protein
MFFNSKAPTLVKKSEEKTSKTPTLLVPKEKEKKNPYFAQKKLTIFIYRKINNIKLLINLSNISTFKMKL